MVDTGNNSIMLERVQNAFLKYVSHVLMIDCLSHNYTLVLRHFNLEILADCTRTNTLIFLLKILYEQIDSSSLLYQIPFKAPERFTRHSAPFNLSIFSNNYGLNEPLRQCMFLENSDPIFSIA